MTDLPDFDEPVEKSEQLLDVGQMQSGGEFIEDLDVALFGHLRGQLEPPPRDNVVSG